MLIANGFITETPSQAFSQVCDRCDGHEVRIIPLPTVETMTYWLSESGDVFGRHLDFIEKIARLTNAKIEVV